MRTNRAQNGGGAYGPVFVDSLFDGNCATNTGGGIYQTAAEPGVIGCSNCTFTGNVAAQGGGAYMLNAANCLFSNNVATANGGGHFGGSLVNCLIISNQAAMGGGGHSASKQFQCSILGNHATDSGGGVYSSSSYGWGTTNCLLAYNSAANSGGGAYGGKISRCTLVGNSAGTNGGGAYSSSLLHCLLLGNSAVNGGGYAGPGSVITCTITGNVATNGGGLYFTTGGLVNSSIIYYNSAGTSPNGSAANYQRCCITPLPGSGSNHITNEPAFVDRVGGNFRLQTNSPCINFGGGALYGLIDLDGRQRVVDGQVDIGAYEFQGAGMGEFIGWLEKYQLAVNGSADYLDTDADTMNNWQEWRANTVPTNALSVLKMLTPEYAPPGLSVSWLSAQGVAYFLERSADLGSQPAFSVIQSNIIGQPDVTTYADTNIAGQGRLFYRVGVQ